MRLRPGLTLHSPTSTAQFVVIWGADGDFDLRCAGAPLSADRPGATAPAASGTAPVLAAGKRYSDEGGLVELLCTKAGAGPLTLAGTELDVRAAKALPSSD